MSNLICLPQDIWREHIFPFVPSLRSLVFLDRAVVNKLCRRAFHNNISGIKQEWQVTSERKALQWFHKRNIAVHSIAFRTKKSKVTVRATLLSTMRKITGRNILHHFRIFEQTMQSHSDKLTRLHIQSDDLRDVSGLRYAMHIIHLTVYSSSNITSNSFVQAISGCPKLRFCSLFHCDQLGEDAVAAVLTLCKDLQELQLSGPANVDDAFAQITAPLQLKKFLWFHSYAMITSVFLLTIANQMPLMEHMEWIASPYSTFTAPDYHNVIRNCVKLKVLHTQGFNPISDHSLLRMSLSVTALKHLNLGMCTQISSMGVTALVRGCTLLEYLDLSGIQVVTDFAIRTLGFHCRSLTHLNVRSCMWLTDDAFTTLNVHTLFELDVSDTLVTGLFTSHILQGSSAVHRLRLCSCFNLHIDLLRALPPDNHLNTLVLEQLNWSNEEWLSLSLLLPNLRNLLLTGCANIDFNVLRSFALHCSDLHMLNMKKCLISRLDVNEIKWWLKAHAGTSRQITLVVDRPIFI